MIKELQKGYATPLPYTKEGRGRVTVGISWDTPEFIPERPEAFVSELDEGANHYDRDIDIDIGFTTGTFDLDLVCLMYNEERELVDAVSPAPTENVDLSGAVYHTGDDTEGSTAGDDEQISIELAKLPEHIHSLVFLSIIQSRNTFFKDVLNAACRVGDGKTNSDIWALSLAKENKKTACVMLSLSRKGHNDWQIKNISEYRVDKDIEDWGAEAETLF